MSLPRGRRRRLMWMAALLALALTIFDVGRGQQTPDSTPRPAAQTLMAGSTQPLPRAAESEPLKLIWRKLLAAVRPEERPKGFFWPPALIGPDRGEIERFNTMISRVKPPGWKIEGDEINAYAALLPQTTLAEFQFLPAARRSNTPAPFIVIAPALHERILKQPGTTLNHDRAAFLLAHELAHVLKSHVSTEVTGSVEGLATSRAEEFQADAAGMELALRTGFSKDNGLRLYQAFEEKLEYSSIEGQKLTHPSNKERLAELDKKQRELWRAMVDFDNGVFLLTVEQYNPAIKSFEAVLREFPESHEAWANLGYSQLMKYCDALVAQDLLALNLGPLVVGTFYERPDSLRAQIKGFDEPLWNEAVNSLQRAMSEAEKAGAATSLIKANLGVAFLVKPSRAAADVARARVFFADALAPNSRGEVASISRAAVLINAGVADLADNKPAEALLKLDAVREFGWWDRVRRLSFNSPYQQIGAALLSAECFNRGLARRSLATTPDDSAEASAGLCRCMSGSPSASYWQRVMLARLSGDGGGAGPPAADCAPRAPTPLRMVVSARLVPGLDVSLGEVMQAVEAKLTASRVAYEVMGQELKRIVAHDSGFEVLGGGEVIGIVLQNEKAEPVQVRDRSPSGNTFELRVGMKQSQVENLLGRAQGGSILSTDVLNEYRFYPYVGLAVKYTAAGRVAKLVVVQAPRRG